MPVPDPASPRLPGWRLQHLAESPSTNAVAVDAVRRGEAPGLVVLTDHQTAGRGRLDRTWQTPAGEALTFSAVVDPAVPDERWPWLPLLVGVAVSEAVAALTGLEARVKWPNDVLLDDLKLTGILVERVAAPDRAPLAVLGVGVNVHQQSLPVPTATSLARALPDPARVPDRLELLAVVLERVRAALDDWAGDGGPARLAASYAVRSATLGRRVRAELPGGHVLEGTAHDLDAHGRLVILDAAGLRHAVGAGDVVHLRGSS